MSRALPLLGLLLIACPPPDDTDPVATDTPDPGACPFDDAEGSEAAEALAVGSSASGYLCPQGDQDWLRVEHPGGLLRVEASIEGTIAPVQPTWTVWDAAASEVLAAPMPDEAATAGAPLSLWHDLPGGPVLLQVRDQGNDAEDTRRAWSVSVEARDQPDATEPNNEAVPLPPSPVEGVIASRADVDRFTLEAATRQLLRVRLQVPAGGYDPELSILDGEGVELITLSNPAGRREATDLSWTLGIPEDTTLTLQIRDDDDREHDPDTAWTLTWSLGDDPDVDEPNDHPRQASLLGTGSCGPGWDEIGTHDGYLATTGDVDWLSMPLSCGRGLVEAELSFDTGAAALPDGFVPTLRLVREVPEQSCTIDQDCAALDRTCRSSLDCEGYGNTCLGSGQCAGASVCLPTGSCGATLLVERADEDPSTLRFSAPLPELERAWLAVSEQGGDGLAPDTPYALSVRTRADPDSFEPNHVYTAGPPTGSASGRHTNRAVELPVYDCRPLEDDVDDTDMPDTDSADTDMPEPREVVCCDRPERFTTGHIAHAYDQDWFRYAHPCPGEDCMVRVHIEHDEGPVDLFAQIFRGDRLWYDGILGGTTDVPTQPARSVSYGGLEEDDQCFYAFNGHNGSPFWYHVALRDTVFRGGGDPTGGTWDWSPDQEYRVCVERIADGCAEPPCKLFTDGCGTE